jgi:hypothetical protein
MGKGQKSRNQPQAGSSTAGGVAQQRNALAARNEASIVDPLRPGRHACRCQARKHELVMNCLGCGKIVCKQEGSGPCLSCGRLVCTMEEKEILDRGSKKAVELYEKITGRPYEGERGVSLFEAGSDLELATEFRNKLLAADADSERRTRVNDLESDYSNAEKDPFLTHEERKRIRRRQEELKEMKELRKRQLVLSLNLADLSVTEEKGARGTTNEFDPVIQEILDKSEERRKAMEAIGETAVDARWIPKGFVPKYTKDYGTTFRTNVGDFQDVESVTMMNEELAQLDVERRGYALAIEQPLATLAAAGKIRFLRWREDIQLKGPVFITSYARSTKIEAIEKAVREFCKDSTAIGLDYTPGSLHGRVFVDDCLTRKEFEQEHGSSQKVAGTGDFVLIFTVSEPLRIPIPYVPPKEESLFQLDKEMRKAMVDVFK